MFPTGLAGACLRRLLHDNRQVRRLCLLATGNRAVLDEEGEVASRGAGLRRRRGGEPAEPGAASGRVKEVVDADMESFMNCLPVLHPYFLFTLFDKRWKKRKYSVPSMGTM